MEIKRQKQVRMKKYFTPKDAEGTGNISILIVEETISTANTGNSTYPTTLSHIKKRKFSFNLSPTFRNALFIALTER